MKMLSIKIVLQYLMRYRVSPAQNGEFGSINNLDVDGLCHFCCPYEIFLVLNSTRQQSLYDDLKQSDRLLTYTLNLTKKSMSQ